MTGSRRGYSLTEMLVTLAIMGVIAAMVVPRLSYGLIRKKKAETAAYKLMADLRLTRSLAIRDAAVNSVGYKLQMTGSVPYSGYTILNKSTSVVVATHTFESGVTVSCPGVKSFTYLPLGNLKADESGTRITIAANGVTYTLTLDAVSATGTVKCTTS